MRFLAVVSLPYIRSLLFLLYSYPSISPPGMSLVGSCRSLYSTIVVVDRCVTRFDPIMLFRGCEIVRLRRYWWINRSYYQCPLSWTLIQGPTVDSHWHLYLSFLLKCLLLLPNTIRKQSSDFRQPFTPFFFFSKKVWRQQDNLGFKWLCLPVL